MSAKRATMSPSPVCWSSPESENPNFNDAP